MKKILLVLTALMLALSCSKEGANPEVVISSPTNNAVGKDGGTVTLSFSSAIEWTATSSATWCTLSASKGDGGNSLSIKVTCAKNETYDSRTATVTIKSGGTVAKSITIEQDAKDGLIISSNRMDLNNDAQQITITLQKNVEYTYTINGEWITPVTASSVETKALSNETLKFNVAENTTYDNREGSITFKSAKGDLSSTVTLKQKGSAKGFLSAKTPGLYNLESQEAEYAYSKYEHLLVIAPAVSTAKGYFRLVQNKENAFLSVENIPDMARLAAESTVELQIVQNITTRMQYSHKRVFTVAKISENLVWLKSESDNIGLVIQMK